MEGKSERVVQQGVRDSNSGGATSVQTAVGVGLVCRRCSPCLRWVESGAVRRFLLAGLRCEVEREWSLATGEERAGNEAGGGTRLNSGTGGAGGTGAEWR